MSGSYSIYKDAPGLLNSLKKILTPPQVEVVVGDFTTIGVLGGYDEGAVKREHGASYNPRPARIAAILLADKIPLTLLSLRVALWSTVPKESAAQIPDELKDAVGKVWERDLSLPQELGNVILAHVLDEVRHLHMTELMQEAKLIILQRAKREVQMYVLKEGRSRLEERVLDALQKQERILEESA